MSKEKFPNAWLKIALTQDLEKSALLKKALEEKNLDGDYFIALKPGEVFNL